MNEMEKKHTTKVINKPGPGKIDKSLARFI